MQKTNKNPLNNVYVDFYEKIRTIAVNKST